MFRSLRHRDFRIFFFGHLVSLVGNWMQMTAQSWLVYRLTRDPFHLGMVAFVGQFPVFLLGLYAGVVIDRMDRHRLVLWTQSLALVQAAAMAWLTARGDVALWQVYVLAALLGGVNAFDIPARQVLIGELVTPEERHNAIALNSSIVNGSRIVGPALAGLLIRLSGEWLCFSLNALSYSAVLAALSVMRGTRAGGSGSTRPPWMEMREGFSYVLNDRPIRGLLCLIGAVSMAGMPFVALMPIFADEILHVGSTGMGLLMGVSGIGATAGALLLAKLPKTDGIERLVLRMTPCFAAALAVFAFSRRVWLSAVMISIVGLGIMVQLSGVNALLQELVVERFRGRVMGFYAIMFIGLAPFGSFAAGILASRIGAPWTVALGACCCLAAALRCDRTLPAAVRERRAAMQAGS